MLSLDTGNDPVPWADDMATLKGVDPTVLVHRVLTLLANTIRSSSWMTEVTNYPAFKRNQYSTFWEIIRMITVLKPLSGLDLNGFLSEFHP